MIMNKHFFVLGLILLCATAMAQTGSFDLAAYRQFITEVQNLSAAELTMRYPAGRFEATAPVDWSHARYADSVAQGFNLTDGEKKLLQQNGFMVSERLSYATFIHAFAEIYYKDLPLFISADAILHAVHISYDEILKQTELQLLLPRLQEMLETLHGGVPGLAARYQEQAGLQPMIRDIDLYLALARNLLDEKSRPIYKQNQTAFSEIRALIDGLQPAPYPLFATTPRKIDFSQFQVRGHYADEFRPELGRYFRAMMWLGRTELYLIAPSEAGDPPGFADIQRQIIDALLLQELLETTGALANFREIDQTLAFFVGECDNVTPDNLAELKSHLGIGHPAQLLDSLRTVAFQDTLAHCPFAWQRINSQMLYSDPLDPDTLRPASAFLLMGQRFIIDSYITGQVVYDKITHNGSKVTRMLPSTLDVLFGLGNDAAGQLLQGELEAYHYAPNLAAVRYLIDGYDEGFWKSSLFNHWLAAIRTLNPPADRNALPSTLRTAAWWQRLMNTQLASWTELRHDNLLYAKQSYSGMVTCSYPKVYIEPVPEFYAALARMARAGAAHFAGVEITPFIADYFKKSACIFDTLQVIAEKLSAGMPLDPAGSSFLQRTLREEMPGCGGRSFSGWYPQLYVESYENDGLAKADYVVADVHTSPTDAFGSMVGWVKHVGTGPVNLGVIVLPLAGENILFAGPMMSYYEHLTTNFKRLTDSEWSEGTLYQFAPSLRPEFVNLYLADHNGDVQSSGITLLTGIAKRAAAGQPSTPILAANWPNPFNAATLIRFSIPSGSEAVQATLAIYDRRGRLVRQLFAGRAAPGHYLTRWDGCDDRGQPEPSGIYFYRFILGEQVAEGKMSLIR
jgi:hypothetical protein